MFPLRDYAGRRRITFPYVNLTLIALNALVFIYELSLGDQLDRFAATWGASPARFFDIPNQSGPDAIVTVLTLFTAMFIHGGWLHIGGNMLFLWVFGDNIEDSMGHVRYVVFYLLCGLIAMFAQFAPNISSPVPTIGASGAISGILGAYMVLFPRGRVVTLILIVIIPLVVRLPALVLLGYWIALQVFQGFLSLSDPVAGEGVAFFAHIGGFIAGAGLIWVFRKRW